jgi:hypothetical protein
MRKITLGLSLLAGLFAVGQNTAVPVLNVTASEGQKLIPLGKGMLNQNSPIAGLGIHGTYNYPQSASDSAHGVFDFATAVETFQLNTYEVQSSDFTQYLQPVYIDSNVITSFSVANGGNAYVNVMSAGNMFDPRSPIYDPTGLDQTALLYPTQQYVLDTVAILGAYTNSNGVFNDTLYVTVAVGPASALGAAASATVLWEPITQTPSKGDTSFFDVPFINPSKLLTNASSVQGPIADIHVFKYPFTRADSVVGNAQGLIFKSYILDSKKMNGGQPIIVKDGQIVSTTYTFVPGRSPVANQVVFSLPGSVSNATQNGFVGALFSTVSSPSSTPPAQGYFYDTSSPRYNNYGLVYTSKQRYSGYTGNEAFINSIFIPWTNSYPRIIYAISYLPSAAGIKEYSPVGLTVSQNAPNPFSNTTIINYQLAENVPVSLDVFDITGQKVQTVSEGMMGTGAHQIVLNSANLQAGMYFYALTAGQDRVTKRMTVIR